MKVMSLIKKLLGGQNCKLNENKKLVIFVNSYVKKVSILNFIISP